MKNSKKSGKNSMIIALAAVILIAAIIFLIPGKQRGSEENLPPVQNQQEQKPDTAAEPKVPAREIPDGTILVDETFNNGDLVIVALDDRTLWVRLTDDRPHREYNDLGTPWEISLSFGEKLQFGDIASESVDPYFCKIQSPAHAQLLSVEYQQGKTPEYFTEEFSRHLSFEKRACTSGELEGWTIEMISMTDVTVDREGSVYTVTVEFPEWFDVSASADLMEVNVWCFGLDFWSEFCEKGSSIHEGRETFRPLA